VRASSGVAFRSAAPFEATYPLLKARHDDTEMFQFSVGTRF
jgi:outer membrane protein assembly factor BamA